MFGRAEKLAQHERAQANPHRYQTYEVGGVHYESVVRTLYQIATVSHPVLKGDGAAGIAAVQAARELRKLGLLGAPADGGDA